MPGNEVGDRVHNFFDQGTLSQDQRHTQFVAANWPGYNNNIWNANERQIGGPVNTGPENYSSQQSDSEKGQGKQFLFGPNALNFVRQNLRPEFVKNPSQLSQVNLNGFMHTRHNQGNFLGVATDPDQNNMASRSPSALDSQQRRGSQFTNSANFGGSESPMNFNLFGGQHQMNGQQPGIMQSLPRQLLGNNDTQLQQQFILKQLELQRQHQLQQYELNQRSASTHMPGYSNGLMISPEQGQTMQFMGLFPQQTSQSLYGVPVSNSQNHTAFSLQSIDKSGMLQVSAPSPSFSTNQYGAFADLASVKEGNNMVSRYGSEGIGSFEQASRQHLGNMVNLGGFTEVQQRNVPMLEGDGRGFAGGSELVTEKSVSQASSQGAIGLDPTEEKILYGNDNNIWEAFGGDSFAGSGEATDLLNGFPSMQSGTWCALMQSAVRETSSNDGGVQEEWSVSQNSRSQSGFSNEKSQHNLVDSSQRVSLGSQLSNNDVNIHNANTDFNYVNSLGEQQQILSQRRDSVQIGNQIAQQKPHVMEKRVVENSNSSMDFTRTDSGFWGHKPSSFLHNNDAQKLSQPNSSNFIGSVPENGDKDHGKEMRMNTGHGAVTRLEHVPNSNSRFGNSHSSKDGAVAPGLNSMKVNLESSQKLSNNHNVDMWKSVHSSGKFGFEGSGRDQHNLNKVPSMLGSSDNSPDGGTEKHEIENGNQRSLPGGKEMSSGQAGERGPVTQKLQYHPMGNVDVNVDSYAAKQVLYSQSMSQHFPAGVKGQGVNRKFSGPLSTNITDMEGRVSNYHGPVNASHGVAGGVHPGNLPNSSAAFVRSGEISSPNQHLSPSQNVLELLHKVDQSKEQNAASLFSSTDNGRLSDTTVGGVAGPRQSHFSTSHGFSLQLAPPSQVIAPSYLSDSVRSSSQTVVSPSTGHVASEKGDGHSWLVSVSSAQCLPPFHQPTQMDSGIEPGRSRNFDGDVSEPNLKDNLSISSLKSPPQIEHSTAPSRRIIDDQSSKDNLSHLGNIWASQQHLLGAQACNAPELLKSQFRSPSAPETSFTQLKNDVQDGLKSVGASSSQGIVGGEESQTAAPSFVKVTGNSQEEPSARHLPDASPSFPTINQKDIEPFHHSENQNNNTHNKYSLMHQMQTMKNLGSDPSHRESKRLKGQDDVHDPNQVAGQVAAPFISSMNSMARDLSMSQATIATGDAKLLNFSPQIANSHTFQFPHGAATSQDMFSFGSSDPQKFAAGNVTCRTEHSGISPQVAPSWLEQYGTFKNGQLLPVHNVLRVPMKNVEHQLISGNSPNNLVVHNSVQLASGPMEAGPIANTCRTTTAYIPSNHVSSLHALVPRVSSPSPASMRPKKRKTVASDLLPWNIEIKLGLKRLQNLSSAEVDWAHSSNRLIEKVEDETDENEDVLPMTRPRNRLLLTTQLMQQVLRPPSAGVLSLDASSDYEVIVYSLARSVLSDACGLICGVESNSPVESANLSEKAKTSVRIQDQYFSKVVKDFESREKELENELLRLSKCASFLDVRLDCQDLERFSVINRFAKFHSRGQVDGAETSSSSEANATVLRPFPQRYVSAHSMPRIFPESVQCLSL